MLNDQLLLHDCEFIIIIDIGYLSFSMGSRKGTKKIMPMGFLILSNFDFQTTSMSEKKITKLNYTEL